MKQDFQPDWFSPPGSTVATLMARKGISISQLAQVISEDTEFVLRLLSGIERIEGSLASVLATTLGATPGFWSSRQSKFDDALRRTANRISSESANAWLRDLPLREMQAAGWIGASPRDRENALRSALAYFGVTGPEEWRERYTEHSTQYSYRASQTYSSKLGALAAWLRQGELQASGIRCANWDADRFRTGLSAIRALTRLKSPSSFLGRLRTCCAEAGVAVVFVKAPSGCRVSGATRFVSHDKAMIILSFRHLSDDHFWFSFFHEAGHLLLHAPDSTFVDGDAAEDTDKEQEANSFSARLLVPTSQLDRLMSLRPTMNQILRFAVSIGIAPGIVVGQLQHHGVIGPNQFNSLKRRYTWEDVQEAVAKLTL